MSSSTNNNPPFWPTWRTGRDYGAAYAPNTTNDSNRIEPVFRHSMSFQPTAVRLFLLIPPLPVKKWLIGSEKRKKKKVFSPLIHDLNSYLLCCIFRRIVELLRGMHGRRQKREW